jgi:hypothetical protein
MEDLFPFLLVPAVVLMALEALVRWRSCGGSREVGPRLRVAPRGPRGGVLRSFVSGYAGAVVWASARRCGRPKLRRAEGLRAPRELRRDRRRAVKAVLLVLAMLFAFAALARPKFGSGTRIVPATNLDVVIVLDYSKSMYARDVAPSAASRARRPRSRASSTICRERASAPWPSPASR